MSKSGEDDLAGSSTQSSVVDKILEFRGEDEVCVYGERKEKEMKKRPAWEYLQRKTKTLQTGILRSVDSGHIEGFKPEVAWVTRAGEHDLPTPYALRPTSETIIYPYFKNKIRTHRDLPMKVNQWVNVVRWEVSDPIPLIRGREFDWQEGHSAFATKKEADEEVLDVLNIYSRLYEELLAVPVIKGQKSEKEKFAGAVYTTSVEAFIPKTGCGVQAATSNCLGQNFAKMFEITFEDKEVIKVKNEKPKVWQNSWGLSTRSIGVMAMTHGDDKGLVLPPKVARYQVVVIPVSFKGADTKRIVQECQAVKTILQGVGVRACYSR
ncbi:unnamed protein product [Eruca vesicaria subsp. sativa]|uniref:proline--tRNA ligase n=1 Tax=Eruca vesicaria subsp. sativa TaxID=29727 RepID=A0ABC8JQ59_ERUVS|nr:unnamed protein product [Eruca vesicaria subsp. sativa]